MKVAIDISPLEDGHKVRGIGYYLKNLKENLEKQKKDLDIIFVKNIEDSKDASLLHIPYFDPFFLTLPSSSKIPYVVTVHDLIPLVFPSKFPAGVKGKIRWEVQKRRLRKAQAIITDSESSKNDIAKIIGYPPEKINVVYLAASEKFKPYEKSEQEKVRKKYDLAQKYVLYVGDATWNKNVVRLFNVVKDLRYPTYVIGKALSQENIANNPWNEELLEAQKVIASAPNIHTLGFVPDEDLHKIYSGARLLAFPSLYEGFGLPVIEAMAAGVPVVTTKGGSLEEVAGDSALIVDGYSEEELKSGIRGLYEDDKLFEKYKTLGFNNAKRFSWDKTAKQTLEVYEKVLSGN